MIIFPAIDLIGGAAVRLVMGDYGQKTVYSNTPLEVAKGFKASGAEYLHAVDLDGAKSGGTPNFDVVSELASKSGLMVEIGGGIRDMDTVKKYLDAGAFRVILGSAAVKDPDVLMRAVDKYNEKIAVGVDIKEGKVAIHGWLESTELEGFDFCGRLEKMGVSTVICTDISKDGMMKGTNLELYRRMSESLSMNIVASGGVSSIDDVRALRKMDIYGAILGKALYTGAVSLTDAIKEAK